MQRVAGHVRAGLRHASAPLPGQAGALLPALVDGDTSGLSTATEQQFRVTGLTHLVAVSGENLAVVTGVTLGLVRRLRFGPRATAVVTACAIAGFVVLARPSPSVLRAAVMGAIGLAALAGGRPRPALASLSAATLLLVLADPSLARQAGFALSVLASLGLLVLAPGLAARFARRLPSPVATAIAVPVAAQLACTPRHRRDRRRPRAGRRTGQPDRGTCRRARHRARRAGRGGRSGLRRPGARPGVRRLAAVPVAGRRRGARLARSGGDRDGAAGPARCRCRFARRRRRARHAGSGLGTSAARAILPG